MTSEICGDLQPGRGVQNLHQHHHQPPHTHRHHTHTHTHTPPDHTCFQRLDHKKTGIFFMCLCPLKRFIEQQTQADSCSSGSKQKWAGPACRLKTDITGEKVLFCLRVKMLICEQV